MKSLATILLITILFSCQKEVTHTDHLKRSWGAIPEYAPQRADRGKGKHNPPPPDTTPVTPPVVQPPVVTFPASFKLQMPPVIDQGSEGSCVSMAIGYYQLSAEVFYKGASSYDYNTNIFSPEYLYDNQAPHTSCYDGSTITGNYNFLISTGDVLWKDAPYTANTCDPFTSNAPKTKISVWPQPIPSDRIDTMKTLILQHHPLVFTFTADYNFYYGDGQPNYVWSSYSNQIYGGHCCTVVGWDDSKKAWLIINSFGSNWGDNGYRWIDYTFFAYIATQTYNIAV